MKIPPINLQGDAVAHARWLEERALAAEAELSEFRLFRAAVSKQLGMTAGSATETNVQVETNRTDIIELKARAGIPPGGLPGMTITRGEEGIATWTSTPYATVPEYHVTLMQGAPEYYVNNSVDGDDTFILPPVEFADDGTTMLSIQQGDYLQEAPITLLVEVIPQFDGETFTIYVPAAASFYGGSAPYFILSVTNGSLLYSADVSFENNEMRYAGTNVAVEDAGVRVLEPRENLYWFVQSGGADLLTSQVFAYPNGSGGTVGFTDRKYTLEVAAVRDGESWSAIGDLEPALGGVAHTNGTSQSKIVGKITAQVTTAPTGSGVEVMVYLNGSPILSTPLVVAAGTTYAEVVPDAGTTSINAGGFSYPVVVFDPGDRLTVEILDVGSTTPGTGLVVQALYG